MHYIKHTRVGMILLLGRDMYTYSYTHESADDCSLAAIWQPENFSCWLLALWCKHALQAVRYGAARALVSLSIVPTRC